MMDFSKFLEALGGLHDAKLLSVTWACREHKVVCEIDDLFANFLDLPNYPRRLPATITLNGVTELIMDWPSSEVLSIFEWEVDGDAKGEFGTTIRLSPSGQVSIRCMSADYPAHEVDTLG